MSHRKGKYGDTLYFDSYAIDGDKETRVDQFAIVKDLADDEVVTPDEPTTDTPVTPDEPTTDKPVVDKPEDDKVVTDNPEIPNTSTDGKDNTPVYIAVFMLVSAGLVTLTLTKKKRRTKA